MLPALNCNAQVYFYSCEKCGLVWTHDKRDPKARPKLVLYPREPLTTTPPSATRQGRNEA